MSSLRRGHANLLCRNFIKYCWWKKTLHQLRLVAYPIINSRLCTSQVVIARFLPSTVCHNNFSGKIHVYIIYMNPMGERLPRDDMSTIFSPNASMSCHVSLSKRHRHLQHLRKENSPWGFLEGVFLGRRVFTQRVWRFSMYMGVSKNRGTPKWMVYKETPIKMDDLGVPLFSETSI